MISFIKLGLNNDLIHLYKADLGDFARKVSLILDSYCSFNFAISVLYFSFFFFKSSTQSFIIRFCSIGSIGSLLVIIVFNCSLVAIKE